MLGKAALFGRTLELALIDRTLGTIIAKSGADQGGTGTVFDGNTAQTYTSGCRWPNTVAPNYAWIGKLYPTAKIFGKAIAYPSADRGFAESGTITLSIYGKNGSNPSNATDGTLLGTSGLISDTTSPVTIMSNDEQNAWTRIWLAIVVASGDANMAELTLYELL